jgi:hypothetical protein
MGGVMRAETGESQAQRWLGGAGQLIHQTLRCTPAMVAGVTTKLWELADMAKVLEDRETAQ